MLHLISSIQTPTYIGAHQWYTCTYSSMPKYVVPPEAEKHSSPYILYGMYTRGTTKNSTVA